MNHAIDISKDRLKLDDVAPGLARTCGSIGGAALLAALVVGFWDSEAFFRGYIMNYAFVLSLALGSLFFVLLQHLTRAGWSVVVRRVPEFIIGAFPVLALLFLPILIMMWLSWLGISDAITHVYHWLDRSAVANDHVLHAKEPYLNMGFFTARVVFYFAAWTMMAGYFRGNSLRQDQSGDASLTARMQVSAAPCMLLFALTMTFMAFDLLMSLNPHWFSTIFGVYYFAGSALFTFAAMALIFIALQSSGRVTMAVTTEHFHDLGKLVFAFTVFWAYIGFSQYMLIWYANLPEETTFYVPRQQGVWLVLSFVLLFGHFVFPFLFMISRHTKRRTATLTLGALWMVLMHWLDMGYLVLPHVEHVDAALNKVTAAPLSATQVIQCVLCLVGVGGVFAWGVLSRVGSESLIPVRDPRLGESLAFENY